MSLYMQNVVLLTRWHLVYQEHAMPNQEIINKLKEHKEELCKKYNIVSIGVFGSYARGEATPESDVDVLVEYDVTPGFFVFLEMTPNPEKQESRT